MTKDRDEVRALLTPEQRILEDWIYHHTMYPEGVFVLGLMVGIAADNQSWDFWKVLAEVRSKLLQ